MPFSRKKSVYLDYAATTPIDPRVLQEMMPLLTEKFGNSVSEHEWGWAAADAVEKARSEVASWLGTKARHIFFTSGATESNNWAIRGLIDQLKIFEPSLTPHVLISPIEHACILETCKFLQKISAIELDFLPLTQHGLVDLEKIEAFIKPTTRLIAAIWVHNELGVVNPIHGLGALCRSRGIHFLSDGTQAIGKFPINLSSIPVDMVSFSAHKIYGPKGVGALWVRDPSILQPLLHGGGHERGFRSGTVNSSGIVGLSAALRWAEAERSERNAHIVKLYQKLLSALGPYYGAELRVSSYLCSTLNQDLDENLKNKDLETFLKRLHSLGREDARTALQAKLPHISLFSLPSPKGVFTRSFVPFLGFSRGSACKNQDPTKLPVLAQLGFSEREVKSAFRITLSHQLKAEELDAAIDLMIA
jgi:cysteine desulfurase